MQSVLRTSTVKKMLTPGIILIAFWGLAIGMWQASGHPMPLIIFGYIGTSLGIGLGLYSALPKRHKPMGRRLALFLVGAFLLAFAATLGRENSQIEGFFFGLLAGVIQMGVIHYVIAKIFGPILFGRLWCGWACWTVMVLDLLPFQRSSGRLPGRWGWVRYAHFALSLALVLTLWFGFSYGLGAAGEVAVIWFLVGNALYYALGIGLAFALKDNRAFCKYACPVGVPLKISSRFSLLRVKGDSAKCNNCQACVKMCPMDIRVPDYILNGQRVLSTECSVCQTCISVCPKNALTLTFEPGMGGKDLLRERTPRGAQESHPGGEVVRQAWPIDFKMVR